jgi:hypothetical protein
MQRAFTRALVWTSALGVGGVLEGAVWLYARWPSGRMAVDTVVRYEQQARRRTNSTTPCTCHHITVGTVACLICSSLLDGTAGRDVALCWFAWYSRSFLYAA